MSAQTETDYPVGFTFRDQRNTYTIAEYGDMGGRRTVALSVKGSNLHTLLPVADLPRHILVAESWSKTGERAEAISERERLQRLTDECDLDSYLADRYPGSTVKGSRARVTLKRTQSIRGRTSSRWEGVRYLVELGYRPGTRGAMGTLESPDGLFLTQGDITLEAIRFASWYINRFLS